MSNKRFIARNGLSSNDNTVANVANPILSNDAATKQITDSLQVFANSAFTQANNAYILANSAYTVANNIPRGYTGSIGYTGSQGTTGYSGSFGYTGSQGNIGYTGSQGNIGYTGSQGNQGVIGYTGSKGDQGNIGYTGSQGNLGYTGSSGIDGYTGSIGYTGSQGVAGYTGSFGYTGSKGDTGLGFTIAKIYANVASLLADTSPTGIIAGQFAIIETGDVEDPENSRLYLWDGNVYSYTSDLSGAQGIQGPQGNIGYTGSQGIIGYTGSKGEDGTIGYNGSVGYTGSQGEIGYTGSKGNTGIYIGNTAPPDLTILWLDESDANGVGIYGIPAGGNTGQSLVKSSNNNYDVSWLTITGGTGSDPQAANTANLALTISYLNLMGY